MLGELGADVEERLYFKDAPTDEEVEKLVRRLPGGVNDLISTRGRRYRELNLADAQLTEEQWLKLLVNEPGLWRRPVAVRGDEAIVGYNEAALRSLVD